MNEWISVEDRLPEDWSHIIVCNVNANIDDCETGVSEATYAPCGKGCCDSRFETKGLEYINHDNVTHWMLLPELPRILK